MPVNDFPEPFINCTFVNDNIIYVNLFHTYTLCHHHFFYDRKSREIHLHTKKVLVGSNNKNFPFKCFINEDECEVYSFYRQGQSFRVPYDRVAPRISTGASTRRLQEQKEEFYFEKIYDKDLGKMYLINQKALVCQCSS